MRAGWPRRATPWSPEITIGRVDRNREESCPGADLRVGEIEALPFADRSFDVTTGFNAFQYAADPVRALIEAKRVTRPRGAVVVAEWGDAERCDFTSLFRALGSLLPSS